MVDGYFIEGHVPAEDVKRLLATKPDAKGLTVPGMPIGSPGIHAIDAALYPADVDYLYFVARPDGSHVFTRSLEEHNRARAAIRRGQ